MSTYWSRSLPRFIQAQRPTKLLAMVQGRSRVCYLRLKSSLVYSERQILIAEKINLFFKLDETFLYRTNELTALLLTWSTTPKKSTELSQTTLSLPYDNNCVENQWVHCLLGNEVILINRRNRKSGINMTDFPTQTELNLLIIAEVKVVIRNHYKICKL